jgi:hypothetical protein
MDYGLVYRMQYPIALGERRVISFLAIIMLGGVLGYIRHLDYREEAAVCSFQTINYICLQ